MKPTPKGWPRISSSVFYENASAAIEWLCKAFGFEVRLKVEEDGHIVHSELTFGDGLVMIGTAGAHSPEKAAYQKDFASPKALGGRTTQTLAIFVDDVDAHCARARASGAEIIREPRTEDYGAEYWADRSYGATDPEGHLWWFMQRVRDKNS
jgi:uncharacterized glyoxalase superfamily protein PhnB